MEKITYFGSLPPNSQSGGGDAVNYNFYKQLQNYFQCKYFHINPTEELVGIWKSKIRRKIFKVPGEFNCFSEKRLSHIARLVKCSANDNDAMFFRGFTPWIYCSTDRPYFAYSDINFQTFFENTFSYDNFKTDDLKRIFSKESQWLGNASAVFFESQWGLQKCMAQYQMPGKNFYSIGRAGHVPMPENDFYNGGRSIVLIAKRFYQKGGDIVFEAFKKLREADRNFKFHIVGGGPGWEIQKYPGVRYHGFLKKENPEDLAKLTKILSQAFLLVHLSREDTNPLVITEAGYYGCPSVSVDNFAIPELIRHNETGVLLSRGAVSDDLYQVITGLCEDRSKYMRMRQKVWEYTHHHFSWDAVGAKVNNIILSLPKHRGRKAIIASDGFSKKRTLILEPSGERWGSEATLLDFLKSPMLKEWDVGVCCPPNTPILKTLAQIPVTIFPSFIANLHVKGKIFKLIALTRFFFVILNFKPELIYVNQAGVTRLALMASMLFRIPVISCVRLVDDVKYIESLKASAIDLPQMICVSNYIYDMFGGRGIISTKQRARIYDPYVPRNEWRRESFKESAIKDNSFACIGRLAYTKGQDVLLYALAELKKKGIPANAVFAGSAGPGDVFGRELLSLMKDLKIEDVVTWAGFQNNVFSVASACTCWICPSRHEPFGRIVLEAWDAGTIPIACKDSGGPAEMIRASGGGILYEKQTGESLAEAMIRGVKMPVIEREDMVMKGRAWIKDNCDLLKASKKIIDIWEDALSISKGHRRKA